MICQLVIYKSTAWAVEVVDSKAVVWEANTDFVAFFPTKAGEIPTQILTFCIEQVNTD